MDDSEAVGDEGVGQSCVLLGELLALGVHLGGLARVEADVLQKDDLSVLQGVRLRVGVGPDGVGRQRHVDSQELGQAGRDRGQGEFGLDRALRAAEMRGDHDTGAGVEQALERGQGGADAAVVGDVAVLVERHVEVGPDEDPLPGEVAERIDSPHCVPFTKTGARTRWGRVRAPASAHRVRASSPQGRRGRRGGWSIPTRCRTRRRPSPGCR